MKRRTTARLSAANAVLTDQIDRLILDRAEWMQRAAAVGVRTVVVEVGK